MSYGHRILCCALQCPHAQKDVAVDLEAVFVFIWKDAAGKDGVTIIDEDFDAAVIDEDAQMRQTLQEKSEQILAFAPGEIVEVAKKYFVIACGEGALRVRNLQPEGKKAMDTSAYLNGNPLKPGMRAGEER